MRKHRWLAVLLPLVLLLASVAAGCGGGDDEEEEAAPTTTEAAQQRQGTACRDVPLPKVREAGKRSAPTALLNAARTYRVRVETSCGTFTITLDIKASPKAAASFVALVESGFFDGTVFHRIVPGFVIRGGDPTATATGGPGYSTVDKPASNTTYPKGAVAMAKAGNEPPGTAGSQFFVMTGDGGLPPEYALVGEVTDGLDVVEKIGQLGDPATEQPTTNVVIETVRAEDS